VADRNKVGSTYEFDWLVEQGKIAEFVAAVSGCPSTGAKCGRLEGSPDRVETVAPPTFTTVPIMWSGVLFRAFEDLAVPLSHIMHAEQSYKFMGRICAGDRLHGVMEIKSITERQGRTGPMEFVLFETVFTNQHRRTVVKEQMLVVERKQP
jgi:hypothetical protein